MSLSFDQWFAGVEEQLLEEIKKYEKISEKKGEKRGEKRGEAKTQKTAARNLLKLGVDVETVAKGVNMDLEKVKKLAIKLGVLKVEA